MARRRGERAPAGYDVADYPVFAVTVDLVILVVHEARLEVLLVERGGDPYAGMWALPGGFKRPGESLEDAAARELAEETGVEAPAHLEQLRAYGDPGRDPRGNVVTVAFLAVLPERLDARGGSDATRAAWWPVEGLRPDAEHSVAPPIDLAFDHRRIVSDAIERVRTELETSDLATRFTGDTFTLSELRDVFEAAWDHELDPANFHRLMTATSPGWVESTDEPPVSSPRGGRPSRRYRATSAWSLGSPLRRPRRPGADD